MLTQGVAHDPSSLVLNHSQVQSRQGFQLTANTAHPLDCMRTWLERNLEKDDATPAQVQKSFKILIVLKKLKNLLNRDSEGDLFKLLSCRFVSGAHLLVLMCQAFSYMISMSIYFTHPSLASSGQRQTCIHRKAHPSLFLPDNIVNNLLVQIREHAT